MGAVDLDVYCAEVSLPDNPLYTQQRHGEDDRDYDTTPKRYLATIRIGKQVVDTVQVLRRYLAELTSLPQQVHQREGIE